MSEQDTKGAYLVLILDKISEDRKEAYLVLMLYKKSDQDKIEKKPILS